MSSDFTFLSSATPVQQWESLQTLMDETGSELSGYTGSAFAPSVQSAAGGFIATWSGLAGERSTMARGFADALDYVQITYGVTDDSARQRMARLDTRLGPAT
jgi:hypothetical protein